jgi:hypothetical protein
VVGASETSKSSSSGSGEDSLSNLLSEVGKVTLNGSGWQSDPNASCPLPVVNAADNLGTHGSSNSSLQKCGCPDSLDQTEQLDEGIGVLSQTMRCETVETISLASQAADSAPCTDGRISSKFAKSSDSLSVGNSLYEGNLPKDGSRTSAHGGDVQQKLFVFGEHAGSRQFTANADQPDVNKVDSADKDGVIYRSEQLNASGAKGSTCTNFILQDAKHEFGSSSKDSTCTDSHEISTELLASDSVSSNFRFKDSRAKVSFNNSALQTTENSHDETEFASSANMEQSGQSGFTFSASTFDQSTLHSQRRHNKKKLGSMDNHANSIQSHSTSNIGLACSKVSSTHQGIDLASQWTECREMQPKMVTFSRGVTCIETEQIGHHGDCEAWRLRYLHDPSVCFN